MARSVQHLPCKQENLSFILRSYIERNQAWWHTLINYGTGEAETVEFLGIAGQPI